MVILRPATLVSVDILYFPVGSQILREFLWQTDDVLPIMPRVKAFLGHWRTLEARIHRIAIAHSKTGGWRNLDHLGDLT